MQRYTLAIGPCVVLIFCQLLSPQAQAGYDIFVDCEYGYGVYPGNFPDPNIACELTWEDTGPNFVNHAEWNGTLVYIPNPNIKDTFISPRFDMRTTAQPVIKGIRCSDVAGEVRNSAFARSYYREPRGQGYTFYLSDNHSAQGHIGVTHPCT
jgi:hypothetical protein